MFVILSRKNYKMDWYQIWHSNSLKLKLTQIILIIPVAPSDETITELNTGEAKTSTYYFPSFCKSVRYSEVTQTV